MPNLLPFPCRALAVAFAASGVGFAADPATTIAWQRLQAQSARVLQTLAEMPAAKPAIDGTVAELTFGELYAPVGDAGLEYSARVRALAGQRVRLSGYMVREAGRPAGLFVLAARPVTVEAGGCMATDVPVTAVHVHLPGAAGREAVPYTPGRIAVTGVLEIGLRHEADGRNSALRLRVGGEKGAGE